MGHTRANTMQDELYSKKSKRNPLTTVWLSCMHHGTLMYQGSVLCSEGVLIFQTLFVTLSGQTLRAHVQKRAKSTENVIDITTIK